MKDVVKVFASWAAAGAGIIFGMKAGEKFGQKIFKEAESKIEEKQPGMAK